MTAAIRSETTSSDRMTSSRIRFRRVHLRSLPRAEATELLDRLGRIMVAAGDADGDGTWAGRDWDGRRARVLEVADIEVALVDGEIVGFVTFKLGRLLGRPCLHLMAAYILPEYQGRHVALALNARIATTVVARRPWRSHYLVMDVLNPIAFDAWRARSGDPQNFFPRIDGLTSPSPHLEVAASELASDQYGHLTFDRDTGVLAAKTLPRATEGPASGNEAVDAHFSAHVDHRKGDTVLVVIGLYATERG
jgi:hypothetical protein